LFGLLWFVFKVKGPAATHGHRNSITD